MRTIRWRSGDLDFDINGKPSYVSDDAKLALDISYYVLEALTQPKMSVPDIHSAIVGAIGKLKRIQAARTDLSPREMVGEIRELFMMPDPTNQKTGIYFFLSVSSQANDIVSKVFDAKNRMDLSHLLPD